MSERSKYAMNGVYKCENFEQHLATGQFPELNIGDPPCASRVYITLKIREELNQVYPYIAFAGKQNRKIRAFFNIKSKFWSLCYQTNGSISQSGLGVSGQCISIQDVLNEENRYLENGALKVEYGLQVEGIQGRYGVWMFNFQNRIFGEKNSSFLFVNGGQITLYESFCSKLLLTFHSSLFSDECKKYAVKSYSDWDFVNNFLQIANGVRLHNLSVYEYSRIIEFAQQFGLRNVVQYCDQVLVREYPNHMVPMLKGAILFNMRHIVARLIQQWDLKELLKKLRDNLDEIPGEMMKLITRKFINEEF